MRIHQGDTGADAVRDLAAAWSQIATYASAVDARLNKWLADTYNLGPTEYRALVLLSKSPAKELRVNDLALQVGLNQSSVTRLLGRLEAKELTYRDACPDDGRGVYAVIADKGEALVAEVRKPYEAKVRDCLKGAVIHDPGLDADQLSRAVALLGDFIAK